MTYGDGVADRIRSVAPKANAFIDTHGGDYVELALGELGILPDRVDTIVRFDAVEKYGVKAEGNAVGASAAVLAELAGLIAAGELEVPIARSLPADAGPRSVCSPRFWPCPRQNRPAALNSPHRVSPSLHLWTRPVASPASR